LVKNEPEQSGSFRPELFSGCAVDHEVDGRVEDEEQVVQVLPEVKNLFFRIANLNYYPGACTTNFLRP
jgi:hypothetical protein